MLDRMINGLLEEGGSGGRTSVMPGGIALLPFVSISDRATIGYEVIARPPLGLDPVALVHHGPRLERRRSRVDLGCANRR